METVEKTQLPKSCKALIEVTNDVRAIVARTNDGDTLRDAIGTLQKAWQHAQRDNIQIYSPQGSTMMPILIAYADALNEAGQVIGQAQAALWKL